MNQQPDTRPLIERQADAWMKRAYTVAREVERIDRDPCFYCGTRGDLECRHRRAV